MEERGYPVEDFEQRAADISVDYPQVVENYRQGHQLARASADGSDSTENLRQAMRNYRALFEELVEPAADQPIAREEGNNNGVTRNDPAMKDGALDDGASTDNPRPCADPDEDDTQDHSEPDTPDDASLTESTGYRESRDESAATSESPARDESEKQREDSSLSNEPAELADLDADLPSIEPAELEQKPQETPSNLDRGPLLPDDQSERFTTRWQEIQASFVDQPRDSVEQADALVADLMQRLAASFSNERERLEAQWDRRQRRLDRRPPRRPDPLPVLLRPPALCLAGDLRKGHPKLTG